MIHGQKPVEILSGKGKESISNPGFRIMTIFMRVMDLLGNASGRNFNTLNLEPGQTVIDYGCGPARYVHRASRIVGSSGKVIATDIHPLAIEKVNEKIKKHNLRNVEGVLAKGYNTGIESEIADVVYALDMFHMIEKPGEFLEELRRLVKKEGRIILEDGHQPRSETKSKVEEYGRLRITQETRSHLVCQK